MASFDETVKAFRHNCEEDKLPLPRVTLGAINKDGTFHCAKAFGEESADPTDADAVHWIASASKFVTTIAAMQCVERGQLSLDSDIAEVLPEWKDPQILTGFNDKDEPIFRPATKAVTLRQMLTHSSGMAYTFMDPLLARYHELHGNRPLIQQTIKESFHTFLLFEPGERWLYSPSIDWAGLAIERATSMPLGAYMEQQIFRPVSANDTTFHLDQRADLRARKVKNWEREGHVLVRERHPIMPDPVADDFGGAGLYATVTDMLKLYRGVLTGTLLRPATVREMFKSHLQSGTKGLDDPAEYATYRNAVWNATAFSSFRKGIWNTVPDDVPVSFGLGGLVNTAAVPGRRGENSLTWWGFPNCYWWMDLNNGVAGIYLSQLVPAGDNKTIELLTEFEKFVYSSLDKSTSGQ
ncbi:uncharacterized protein K452DRAFT_229224 [Aplosporella prunicola CBS 121167]|uniref:Beta-lactamase-related domain-containing protein n=1 Tax=Aplosporella prunicola CBS 121167 TaxID=1176127 RepID=A0A6A6B956_9PEZI|nr:uncharacterized protein K452DRAFT_229224 [Aplosporella prunicola CBS 121167]KAF2140822.1 hypothetical protein K452DRAFT_229224 [Aplosporella prunicola CBS 121167]